MTDFEPGLDKAAHIALEELYLRSVNPAYRAKHPPLEHTHKLLHYGYAAYDRGHCRIAITDAGKTAYVNWVDSCQPEKKTMTFE